MNQNTKDSQESLKGRMGTYISASTAGEKYKAFIPPRLPPKPPLDMERLSPLLSKANQELGRLDAFTELLPDIDLFIYLYVRKEAVLSSQIEGTQSSLSDLLLFESKEAPGVPLDDVQEVSNYVAAMNHGLQRIEQDFPLSNRLLNEMHAILLSKARGASKMPGEFRQSQNWIGGTRPGNAVYVPPPADKVPELMGDLEKFLHDESWPVLLKAGLAHVQFETIHPYLDGNGRLGRLLITLLLCVDGVLRQPILYLSLYFKFNRQDYYALLDLVRVKGDWESWMEFFLTGIIQTASQAAETATTIKALFRQDEDRIETLGRASMTARKVYEVMKSRPLISSPQLVKTLGITKPAVNKALANLQRLGIITEKTGKQRDRLYVYQEYLNILERGTEPLSHS